MNASNTQGAPPRASSCPVLVLAEHPEEYADAVRPLGLAPIGATSVAELLGYLATQTVSGFVLEVEKVLHAPAQERGHLFHLAEAFPLLRVRRNADSAPVYLDDMQTFAAQARSFEPRRARNIMRSPVVLQALMARADDPDFLSPKPVTILDVSPFGGATNCDTELALGEEVRLRIQELSDPAPIRACVCWCKQRSRARLRFSSGLRFFDISPTQISELALRFLEV